MDLITMITMMGCFFAILSVIVCLFLHLGNKIDAIQLSISREVKDFHGRLERQDAEFKAHLIYEHSALEKK